MQGRGRFENRTLELASISRSLKGLAKELQRADRRAVAAAAARRSRAPTTGRSCRTCASRAPSSRTPTSSSFIYREDLYADKSQPPTDSQGVAELIIGKQRNGPTGVVKLAFIREFTRFENLAPARRRLASAMIRPTVARVDLARAQSQLPRTSSSYLARPSGRPRRPASSPSSRRTRTGTAPARWRLALEEAGADCWRAPTSKRASRCARPACSAEILVFGALSVSDLDGLFDCGLTPTISTPGAARAVQAAAATLPAAACATT